MTDFAECTYTVEFKWTGGASGARVFEAAGTNGDAMWLSPSEGGKMIFAIRKGDKIEKIATDAVQTGSWVRVEVSIARGSINLSVNGKQVSSNPKASLTPDSFRAKVFYLGRGRNGDYFSGAIKRFTVHCIALARS